MKIMRLLTLAGALFAFTETAVADPISFSTSGYSISGIGAEFQTTYDSFTLTGLSGTVNQAPGSTASVEIGTYSFTVGPNCYACTQTPSGFTTGFTATIDGQTRNILLPWSWSSTGPVDTLAVGAAAPVTYSLGADALTVTGLRLGDLSSAGGTVSGDLMASFNLSPVIAPPAAHPATTVPEPYSVALFGVGLAGLAFLTARRRRSGV